MDELVYVGFIFGAWSRDRFGHVFARVGVQLRLLLGRLLVVQSKPVYAFPKGLGSLIFGLWVWSIMSLMLDLSMAVGVGMFSMGYFSVCLFFACLFRGVVSVEACVRDRAASWLCCGPCGCVGARLVALRPVRPFPCRPLPADLLQ